MPLEIKSLWNQESFMVCQVPKCIRLSGKRVFFMKHFMGNYCQTHAKEMNETWERGGRDKDEC